MVKIKSNKKAKPLYNIYGGKKMPNKETLDIEKTKEVYESLETVADYLESIQAEHLKNGKFFKLAQKVLLNYRTMKYHQVAFTSHITAEKCLEEMQSEDGPFNFDLFYEGLPNNNEYVDLASVYNTIELGGNSFRTTFLESYLSSNRISLEATLSVFCELVLKEIERRNESVYKVLYAEYFDLTTDNMLLEDRIDHCEMAKSSYFRNLNKGITMFSNYLFNPYGEVFYCNDTKEHSEIVSLINRAAQLIENEIKDTNEKRHISDD